MDVTIAHDLVHNYLAIWNETDGDTRRALIAETWSDTATYLDPIQDAAGHDGIERMVTGLQQQHPGLTFHQMGEIEAHHDRIRFSWTLLTPEGDCVAAGTDVAVVVGGRLETVTGFFDVAPVPNAA